MRFRRQARQAAFAAVVLAATSVTLATAKSAPRSSSDDSIQAVRVFAKTVQSAESDLGGVPGFSVGDQFAFSDDLFTHKGGKKVGFSGGLCTVVRRDTPTKSDTYECATTFSLEGGQIAVQDLVTSVDGKFSGTQVGPITGGSGEFRGAGGEVAVEYLTPDGSEVNLTFSLSR